ncbi:hypothetical protein I3F58_26495 [Streptomyces sp. MUM 203J]|nr:hypothetical protein [Streptomyces sp. MUM 203J]MCH0543039.1 hypothetical protein [Streptomyces sp. MUM 203J]
MSDARAATGPRTMMAAPALLLPEAGGTPSAGGTDNGCSSSGSNGEAQ